MDYRRLYGLRAPRPIGDSTYMIPQMENYALFASPFLDLNKKIGKIIEEMQQDVKSKSVKDVKAKEKEEQTEASKPGKDKQKLSEETTEVDVNFGIVLNVVTVNPEDLFIKFGEGNEIEVKVEQSNAVLKDTVTFSRRCYYKYELPDGVDKSSLIALRTSDDYLIILPSDLLREDLLQKSIEEAKELESFDENVGSPMDVTESADQETDERVKSKPKGSKPRPKKESEVGVSETVAEGSSKSEKVSQDTNCLIPVQVARMLRPGMDIFMLRKYMADLESYVSTVRKFVENASFISQNSKSAERCLRGLAKEKTDKYYEDRNIKPLKKKGKFSVAPSPESGYTSSDKHSAKQLPDTSDESSRGYRSLD